MFMAVPVYLLVLFLRIGNLGTTLLENNFHINLF